MDEGAEYATVLAEAQAKGYAEADPTEDVGGFDARAKLAILMRLALRVVVDPEEIVPQSITAISAVDFSYAHDLGFTIRQVSRAEKTGGTVAATVGPDAGGSALAAGVVARHGEHGDPQRPLRRRRGVFGTRSGRTSDGGGGGQRSAGAGARVAAGRNSLHSGEGRGGIRSAALYSIPGQRPARYRGRNHRSAGQGTINIRAIVQKPGYPQQALPFVVTVEPCKSSALQRALERIRTMECLLEPPLDLQMLE